MIHLSETAINAVSPYIVHTYKNGVVRFINDQGGIYDVGFTLDQTIKDDGIYQIFILENSKRDLTRDPKIRETVTAIIENFFSDSTAVIMFICDTSDGRQSSRNRLFSIWFNNYKRKKDFLMKTTSLLYEDDTYYCSLLLRKDNPEADKIICLFDDFSDSIRTKVD